MSHTRRSLTRRAFLHGGARRSLAVAVLLGSVRVQDVAAKKIGSIKSRVDAQRQMCEGNGGTLSVQKTAFGSTITTCKEGSSHGRTCVNTKKNTYCRSQPSGPPPLDDGAGPPSDGTNEQPAGGDAPQAGGGAGVDPAAGNDPPPDPGATDGGGHHAGGGAGVDPGGTIAPPNDPGDAGGGGGGGVVLYAAYSPLPVQAKHHRAHHVKHHGKHHRDGRGKGRTG